MPFVFNFAQDYTGLETKVYTMADCFRFQNLIRCQKKVLILIRDSADRHLPETDSRIS